MAMDFGDEVSGSLTRAAGRLLADAFREWLRSRHGASEEKVAEAAENEEVYIPFGQADDAALFAKVCQERGIEAVALTNRDGEGFVRVRAGDLTHVPECVERYCEAAMMLAVERAANCLESGRQLTDMEVRDLVEITKLPDLPERFGQDLGRSAAIHRTQAIADKVLDASRSCRSFEEFRDILARDGIGVTTTKDGENMFYEARRDEQGNLLPYSHEARDWAVGAQALKENYGVDATHDWFEKNLSEPESTDGSLDMDGRTPDLDQGIESHDGMDTDTRTPRIEREQHGTDVAPSEVREEAEQALDDDLSLDAVARDCTAASKQLEQDLGGSQHEIDISDKMSQIR